MDLKAMVFRVFFWIFITVMMTAPLQAREINLAANHPNHYQVVKGDTLWGIAGKFLQHPWQWPDVWKKNPHIQNPHLIYPGDTITLSYVDGQPALQLQRGANGTSRISGTSVRDGLVANDHLAPTIRESDISQAIPVIPVEAVKPFLTNPEVVSSTELDHAPYVLAMADKRVIGGAGDKLYVRGIVPEDTRAYLVYRPGETYKDPDTQEILGYEAVYLASTKMLRHGDPATLLLTKATQEVGIGNRLLGVTESKLTLNYFPHVPDHPVSGHIISVLNGVSLIGQYAVVVIDRGRTDGLEVGHVLEINRLGDTIPDPLASSRDSYIKLPDEKAGVLMVFRTFERVSYALVMRAKQTLRVLDVVQTPQR